ncbi:NAD(P)H-dependent oxidoreductase [Aureibacter tunicatorum]|uniref:NADPH-quinone reductase n=1 Tax=Aureibacter tunicatorum TaxID=866807 RepID=A0AAE3XRR0_9BACT|nr:NAD(P)H-dependent oxidoreductase [Aureibacter tunicatorum]MDR6241402.1 putative NADPH-quinone reductase [Aureibacter tunicatorum]BDD06753.1 NAD(P)H dehydrogenase [Aureibacter tunicatorum]
MKTLIVYNHPYEGSFCRAILDAVCEGLNNSGKEVDVIDLDKEEFDPVMRASDLKAFVQRKPIDPKVLEYKARLESADHLIFIFPIWWELMPALTKGFIDKVIFPGLAYDYKENGLGMVPLLKNLKKVTMITTMNTPSIAYQWIFGNAVKKALLTGTFWKMGYKNRKWISFNMVKQVSHQKREQWLNKLVQRFSK